MLREFSEGINMISIELINGRGGDSALFDCTQFEEVMKSVAKAGPVLFGCESVLLWMADQWTDIIYTVN